MDSGYDPSGRGPIKKRSCTDVICLVLFVIFFIAFIAVGVWAYFVGDVNQLLYPTDSLGNFCGHNDFRGRPYLFYFDVTRCSKITYSLLYGCPTPTVCIKECPAKDFTFLSSINKKDYICKYHVNVSDSIFNLYELVAREECAAYYLKSGSIASRCFPKAITDIVVTDANNKTISQAKLQQGVEYLAEVLDLQLLGTKLLEDMAESWIIMLIFLGLAVVVSYLLIVIMRWIAGPVILFCVILFIASFGFATFYCFNKYFTLKETNPNDGNITLTTDIEYYVNLYQTWLVLGIIAAIFLVMTLLIALFLRNRILIAIALIKESSRAISSMVFTLVWPVVPLILQAIVFAYWIASMMFVASTGRAVYYRNDTDIQSLLSDIPCDPRENSTAGSVCSFVQFGGNQWYSTLLLVFQLFVWLWVMNFIIGLGQITLAGAFASYYWAFDKKKDLPMFPITSSFARSVSNHLGSIAFGSLLIAICQLIRILLEFLDRRLKGRENRFAKILIKCLKCCFWCLEKFIKFINRNAYIMIAVAGKNFCTSAKNAFSLILRNIIRAAVLDSVTDFLLFLCKMFVVGGIGVLSFFFFSGELARAAPSSWFSEWLIEFRPRLNYYLIPVIIIVIATYVIASVFFSVYSMAVDTLFLCFLEDLERNDGSVNKPYFMNKELLKILGKRNERYREIKASVQPADKKAKKRKKTTETAGV